MKILVKKDEVDERENTRSREIEDNQETNGDEPHRPDGETIVISGLTKHTLQEGESGIPGLKDLPVLDGFSREHRKANPWKKFSFL